MASTLPTRHFASRLTSRKRVCYDEFQNNTIQRDMTKRDYTSLNKAIKVTKQGDETLYYRHGRREPKGTDVKAVEARRRYYARLERDEDDARQRALDAAASDPVWGKQGRLTRKGNTR